MQAMGKVEQTKWLPRVWWVSTPVQGLTGGGRGGCSPPLEPEPGLAPGAGALRTRESGALKREALLDCLDTARACYHNAWARTSVDLAIEVRWPPSQSCPREAYPPEGQWFPS